MRKRLRLKLQSSVIPIRKNSYPKAYLDLRYWWLHELRQLRAKRKYGTASKSHVKAAQRELARLRKEYA